MFDTILRLPVHPCIVHLAIVLVPAAALAGLVSIAWPRFRRWANWGPLALAALSVVLVPFTTESGESLEHRLPPSPLIREHVELGETLLPWVITLAVGSSALFRWSRGRTLADSGQRGRLPR